MSFGNSDSNLSTIGFDDKQATQKSEYICIKLNLWDSNDLFKSSTFKISDVFVFKNICANIKLLVTININTKAILKSNICLDIIVTHISKNTETKRNEN